MVVTGLLVACALLAPATVLAIYAGPARGRWVVVRSLRWGSQSVRDLRFAAFVAALSALVLLSVAGRPSGWSTWTVLALSATLAFPLTLLEGVLADCLSRFVPETWAAARFAATISGSHSRSGSRAQLVEQAHCEVAAARTIVQDPSLLAALDTLEEAVSDYARAIERVDSREALQGLRARLKGVTALTRSCFDDSTAAVGLDRVGVPASDEEVAQVCRELELAGGAGA